jgi:uncharacterized protein (TIGR04168 family)
MGQDLRQPREAPSEVELQIAIAGDLHDQWDGSDHRLLAAIRPDALLLVGDFSEGGGRIPNLLRELALPVACVLGNHDAGRDPSGGRLQRQLDRLGELHCGWGLRTLQPPGLAVVGGRPATAGGGHHLSKASRAVFGPVGMEESADRICRAALAADPSLPLLLLAHCGPSGLGSDADAPCGRDWKRPACDWGDQDLALAVERIQRQRSLPLVVFGHMHHSLRRSQGERLTFLRDRRGTAYLNAACVPRHGHDPSGRELRHFSWIDLNGEGLQRASHRWYRPDGTLLYEQLLWQATEAPTPC